MKIVTRHDEVTRLQAALVDSGGDSWSKTFVDPATGDRWRRVLLDPEHHGGGMPILVKEPMPGVEELLEIAAHSPDPAEIAASAWLLSDSMKKVDTKNPCLSSRKRPQHATIRHARRCWLVGVSSLRR